MLLLVTAPMCYTFSGATPFRLPALWKQRNKQHKQQTLKLLIILLMLLYTVYFTITETLSLAVKQTACRTVLLLDIRMMN